MEKKKKSTLFTRLFGNGASCPRKNGTMDENGTQIEMTRYADELNKE